jgi:predicted metalloprotease with PDZ domain
VTQVSESAPFIDRASSSDVENRTNVFLSYYSFGQVLGAGIDLEIRSRFAGKSLDDWMRAMWRRHPEVDKPYSRGDLEAALAEATGSAEFAREIFGRYVTGREAMNYSELLGRAGLVLRKSAAGTVWLGSTTTSVSNSGLAITGVVRRGSPAYLAGIDRGDRVVRVDGAEIEKAKDWDEILKSHRPGEASRVVVEGRGGRREVRLVWQETPTLEVVTFEKAGQAVTPAVREFRSAWLGSKVNR